MGLSLMSTKKTRQRWTMCVSFRCALKEGGCRWLQTGRYSLLPLLLLLVCCCRCCFEVSDSTIISSNPGGVMLVNIPRLVGWTPGTRCSTLLICPLILTHRCFRKDKLMHLLNTLNAFHLPFARQSNTRRSRAVLT